MIEQPLIDQVINDTIGILEIKGSRKQEGFRTKYLEPIDVVDDAGRVIGTTCRGLAHRLGLRHAVVYAAVYRSDGRLLLQVRGSGRLDIGVGGHVLGGERDLAAALAREFKEEIGLDVSVQRLTLIASYNRDAPINPQKPLERNRERRSVFRYDMSDGEVSALTETFKQRQAQTEVVTYGWFTKEEVRQAVATGKVADGLGGSVDYLFGG